MEKIRIGVIGTGGVAQIEHVPNLLRLKDRFDVVGVCDPSPAARAIVAERWGLGGFAEIDALLAQPLDAVVIASPDAVHREQALAALGAGLHVFCEKPLCYGPADIAELIAARDTVGRVLQVGYMKRFDPAYEALLKLLPAEGGALRQITVEVRDPDAGPYIRHHDWRSSNDLPGGLAEVLARKQREQVANAVSAPLDPKDYRGFCTAYCSSLVHDVNAVHGLLDRLGVADAEIVGAQIFAGGDGGQGTVRLNGGAALWTMSHLTVPRLPDYSERITLVFEDAAYQLRFPSPWLNHHPTGLTVRRGVGPDLRTETIACGYAEAFIEELKGFHASVTDGVEVRNSAESAARDMALLAGMAQMHVTRKTHSQKYGAVA